MSEKKIWEKPEIVVLDVNENTEGGKDTMYVDDGTLEGGAKS